ncbi:MAG: type II secretion system F family protein [Opitutales bacterium]
MPRFSYSAIDSTGRERAGKIEATSESDARNRLSGQGLMVSSIGAESAGAKKKADAAAKTSGKAARSIKQEHLTIFTRQLATLLTSGLPLLRSLEVMIRQERNVGFKVVLESIADSVRSGNNLSEGLAQFPKIFPPIYTNMVRAGEAGGVLDTVLSRLATFMEKDLRTKKKIQSALIYPAVVVSVAVLIVLLLMVFVVPAFEGIFADMLEGAALPRPTQILIDIANFLTPDTFKDGIITVVVLTAIIVGIVIFFKSSAGKSMVDYLALRAPKVGELGTKAAVSRFSRTFGTLLSSGVPILQAIQITRDVIGNRYITKALDRVHDRVRDGENLATPLDQQKVFPMMVTSMVEVGEETGQLSDMLNRIADNYDEDLDNAVSSLTSIIEPVMIVMLAVVVGGIVIALFLPIVEIINRLVAQQ